MPLLQQRVKEFEDIEKVENNFLNFKLEQLKIMSKNRRHLEKSKQFFKSVCSFYEDLSDKQLTLMKEKFFKNDN